MAGRTSKVVGRLYPGEDDIREEEEAADDAASSAAPGEPEQAEQEEQPAPGVTRLLEPEIPEYFDPSVTIGDRVFDLSEPDFDDYMLFMNKVGEVGLRSQKSMGRLFGNIFLQISKNGNGKTDKQQSYPMEAWVFAFLQNVKPADMRWIGTLCLFGSDALEEGAAWMEAHSDEVKFSHVLRALIIRVRLSQDLIASVKLLGLLQAPMI